MLALAGDLHELAREFRRPLRHLRPLDRSRALRHAAVEVNQMLVVAHAVILDLPVAVHELEDRPRLTFPNLARADKLALIDDDKPHAAAPVGPFEHGHVERDAYAARVQLA